MFSMLAGLRMSLDVGYFRSRIERPNLVVEGNRRMRAVSMSDVA